MATGTIVTAWKDATYGYLCVAVVEGDSKSREYTGRTTLLNGQGASKSLATLKTECLADITAIRNAQLATPTVLAISGTVNV